MATASLAYNFLFTRGQTHRYGPHRSQVAELHLPRRGGPHPVVVLIHGGSWRNRYGKRVMRALAADLVGRGRAVWNIEYRRVGEGGGWPETFEDVAAAIDHLGGLDAPLDRSDVSLVGHSAGGHLALWAASRARLPDGAPGALPTAAARDAAPATAGTPAGAGTPSQAVAVHRAAAMAGVCDLAGGFREWHGGAALDLMGASPEREPERWAAADPRALVPAPMPVLLVHGRSDEVVSVRLSRDYAAAAKAAGGEVTLVELDGQDGRHRSHIYPSGRAWRTVLAWLGGAGEQAEALAGVAPA